MIFSRLGGHRVGNASRPSFDISHLQHVSLVHANGFRWVHLEISLSLPWRFSLTIIQTYYGSSPSKHLDQFMTLRLPCLVLSPPPNSSHFAVCHSEVHAEKTIPADMHSSYAAQIHCKVLRFLSKTWLLTYLSLLPVHIFLLRIILSHLSPLPHLRLEQNKTGGGMETCIHGTSYFRSRTCLGRAISKL